MVPPRLATTILFLCLSFVSSEAMNVLVLHPLHGASHEAQLRTLAVELLARGHHVTTVRFRSAKRQVPYSFAHNFTLITLSVPNEDGSVPFVTKERRGRFQLPIKRLWRLGLCPAQIPFSAFKTNDGLCKAILPLHSRLRKRLLRSYDVAIVDAFANECGFALAHSLGTPVVAYWAMPISGGESDYLAGLWKPPPMANTPAIMTKLTDRMNYIQRVYNAFYKVMGHLVMLVQFWFSHAAIQRYLPGTPHPRTLLEDAAGFLENSDVALDYPKALPPNVINVGCMQCHPPNLLPHDLEEFVKGSGTSGIVVFSMGATTDAAEGPPLFFRRLLRVFARLPQRVVMKYDGPLDGIDIPSNVRILEWMPQQDLLGHQNTKVFFSHCGLHGAMEAVYHGVPVVGVPIFGDQADVARMLEDKGMGLQISKYADEDEVFRALSEVIGDPRYRRNALKQQKILLDTQQTPMERALWFIEYIARHQGAQHLKLSTRHYSSVQLLGLDVLPMLVLLIITPLYMFYKVVITLYHLVKYLYQDTRDGGSTLKEDKLIKFQQASKKHAQSIPLVASCVGHTRKVLRSALITLNQGWKLGVREMNSRKIPCLQGRDSTADAHKQIPLEEE